MLHSVWRSRIATLAAVVLFFVAGPGFAQEKPRAKPRPKTDEKWVEKTLKKMTLDEKIGQLLVVGYFGGFLSAESPQYQELMRQVEEQHVGGFVVQTRGGLMGAERSQAYPTAVLANQLQRKAKIPLLVTADFERGTSMRLVEGTSFPFAMAVAATGKPQDAYLMGKITAIESRAVGIHCVFAPVADVNINPDNPIINTRSFGEDPKRVGELVAAFVRGVEENGALATAKHFPGHGDTSTDSHIDLPTVKGDRARLDSVELEPFRAAIAAGASTMMTGHLAVLALEPNPDVPATLSRLVLTDLLRKELKFEGLVFTDAMDMGGVTVRYAPAEAAIRAILAGSDMLLIPPILDAAFTAMRDAVTSGRIPMARIDESVRRVLRVKAKLNIHKQRFVDLDALNTVFGRPEFTRVAEDIADRGITLLRDEPRLLPLDPTRPQRVLLALISGDPDPFPGTDLERDIRWRVDRLEVLRVDTRFQRAETARLPPPENYDLAIVALFVRVADRKGTVGLPPEQAELVNKLLTAGKPTVVVSLGSPYLIERFPAATTWLSVFSTQDVVQRAAARALFGQVAIGGRMPVSVPGVVKLGDGLDVPANPMKLRPAGPETEARLQPAFDAVERAIADKAFPGGVLAVGYKGELAVRPFGKQAYDASAAAVAQDTMYDAASLTKVVVTTTALEMLAQAGRVALDNPIVRYLPEFAAGPQPEWRARVTMQHLLTHSSGLPTHKQYFLEAKSKKELLAKVFVEPLEAEPGTRVKYSDPGFILLGEVVERLTGKSLDVLAREQIFTPLGMNDSMYNPPKRLLGRIAPTENDATFRKRVVHGEVHDENAWAAGGVTGHAGLFTTASDLAAFCQMMLNGGIYAHQRLLRRATMEMFVTPQEIAGAKRRLGWAGAAGQYVSERSYGHTGFTGTSIWMDPEKELFVVLLTNRVHPTRENTKIEQVRGAVHDAVVEALGLAPPPQETKPPMAPISANKESSVGQSAPQPFAWQQRACCLIGSFPAQARSSGYNPSW